MPTVDLPAAVVAGLMLAAVSIGAFLRHVLEPALVARRAAHPSGNGNGKTLGALEADVRGLCDRLERVEISVAGIPKLLEDSRHDVRDILSAHMNSLELRLTDRSKELADRVFRLEDAALARGSSPR